MPRRRCAICDGPIDPAPLWERWDEKDHVFVGEVRCSRCDARYLYVQKDSAMPTEPTQPGLF